MSWPVQSEDLNPIEMVLVELDKKSQSLQSSSAAHL